MTNTIIQIKGRIVTAWDRSNCKDFYERNFIFSSSAFHTYGRKMQQRASVALCGTVGFMLSAYAWYIEWQHYLHTLSPQDPAQQLLDATPRYKALCDIHESMSCSKVLTSIYSYPLSALGILPRGHWLDISQALLGMAFYAVVAAYPVLIKCHPLSHHIYTYLSLFSVAYAAVNASILAFILHDMCLVCAATYFVNCVFCYTMFRKGSWGPASDKLKSM